MFGHMILHLLVQIGTETNLQVAVVALLQAAKQAEIVYWIELPVPALWFWLVPSDPDSGSLCTASQEGWTATQRRRRG
jgi:hypothetical protein